MVRRLKSDLRRLGEAFPEQDDDEKLAIVSAVGVGAAPVTQVAQRHDVTRQQINAWRHELKQKGLWSQMEGRCLCRSARLAPRLCRG